MSDIEKGTKDREKLIDNMIKLIERVDQGSQISLQPRPIELKKKFKQFIREKTQLALTKINSEEANLEIKIKAIEHEKKKPI